MEYWRGRIPGAAASGRPSSARPASRIRAPGSPSLETRPVCRRPDRPCPSAPCRNAPAPRGGRARRRAETNPCCLRNKAQRASGPQSGAQSPRAAGAGSQHKSRGVWIPRGRDAANCAGDFPARSGLAPRGTGPGADAAGGRLWTIEDVPGGYRPGAYAAPGPVLKNAVCMPSALCVLLHATVVEHRLVLAAARVVYVRSLIVGRSLCPCHAPCARPLQFIS